jgi:thymidylate synthase
LNKLDIDYQNLLADILANGVKKKDRTGTGTISVFGREIRHNMKDGFPLLTTKKMYFRGIATELIWFLRGDTNIKYLVENDCHIWDGDAYKRFFKEASDIKIAYEEGSVVGSQPEIEFMFSDPDKLKILTKEEFIEKIKNDDKFANKWGSLGKIYGYQWRSWNEHTDQLLNLIKELKENPDSRRLLVSAWNVSDLPHQVLPPCHYGFQLYTEELTYKERIRLVIDSGIDTGELNQMDIENRNNWMDRKSFPKRRLSLKWFQRSVDTFLGLPFNIASYGLLLEIIAKEVNMIPNELIGSLGDAHIYTNHIEQAKEQIGRSLDLSERIGLMMEKDKDATEKILTMCEPTHDLLNNLGVIDKARKPFSLPKLLFKDHLKNFNSMLFDTRYGVILRPNDFIIDGYKSHPKIEAPLSN